MFKIFPNLNYLPAGKHWLLIGFISFILNCYILTPVSAQFTIIENFHGSTIGSNIKVGGNAYLTSGIDDPEGEGWLRLTKDLPFQSGYAFLDSVFPSNLGILIDFEYKTWRSVYDSYGGADGFSVFFFDANTPFKVGGYGGSLGYAPFEGVATGLAGGYIGIGFDEYGNFSNPTEGRIGGPGERCNSVVIRGPTANNNVYLTGNQLQLDRNSNVNSIDYNTVTTTRPADDVFYRRVKISIEPIGTSYKITVKWQTTPTGNDSTLLEYTTTTPPPSNLKLGFAASTGGGVNYHEIRNLVITTVGGMRVYKTVDKQNAKVGDQLTYQIDVYNSTNYSVSHVGLTDTIKDYLNNPIDINSGIYTINSIIFYNNGYAGNTASGFSNGVPVTTGLTNPFRIDNLSFQANSVSTFIMKATLNNGISPGDIIKNTVKIEVDPILTGITDEDMTNNIFTVSTNVTNTDFKLESSIDKNCLDSINGNTITLMASNIGTTTSNGTVTLRDTIPKGFIVINVSAVGWTITHWGNIYTFTRTDELSGGASYPPIILTIKPSGGQGNCDPIRTVRIQSYSDNGRLTAINLTDNGGTPQWTTTLNDNSAWYEIPVEGSSIDFFYKNVGTGRYLYRESTEQGPTGCDWAWVYMQLSATNAKTDYFKFRPISTPSWQDRYWIVNVAGADFNNIANGGAFIFSGVNNGYWPCNMPSAPTVIASKMSNNTQVWASTAVATINASVNNPDCEVQTGGDTTLWINSAKIYYDKIEVSEANNTSKDTIYAIPEAPDVVSPVTYCQGETASPLIATGNNLLWYTDPTGPGSPHTPTPQTSNPGSITYYVSQKRNDCESELAPIQVIVKPANTFTIDTTVCDSFITRNGKIYHDSGTIKDTLLNKAGCDSIITIHLTVKKTTTAEISPTVCDTYTSPSGKIYYDSGLIMDTIANKAGCDSIITIHLQVNKSSAATIFVSSCDAYMAPDGHIYTDSGIKKAVIPNKAGCDSTILIHLEIGKNTEKTINVMACDAYIAPDGIRYTDSGIKTAIIPNKAGCDSTIIIHLTINQGSHTYQTINMLEGDKYFINGHKYDKEGIYQDTLLTKNGCDSVITTEIKLIMIPNTITPNGDGKNDFFLPGYHVKIYNRNGILLFEGDNGWDGTHRGQPVAPDTYYFVLYFNSASDGVKTKEGYITVIR